MKKTHNTRSKDEKTQTLPKMTMTEVVNEEMSTFSGSSSENNTGSTSSDWSEIIEREATAENLQKQREVDEFPANNSMGINIEGSGNLCDIRSGEVNPPDLQDGINSINTDAGPKLNEATKINLYQHYKELQNLKNKQVTSKEESETAHKTVEISAANPYKDNSQETDEQEAVVIEQDVNMAVVTNLLEVEDPRINPTSEEAVTSNNIESTSNINQADPIIYGEKSN
ncbi:34814_t:CDS:2 [Gigaspora margarita]|uniref:34814_t:CDS:1 n=1 Tax=Gigaspora margarita TaxID=4874 RepID=A0ABM8VZ79_GIGMA|nr:34814_t:CDS:2 [Gigaspora margarita]